MPRINEYKCNKCDLRLPKGWGYCLYVVDDSGKRVRAWHPVERRIVKEVLGERASILEVVRQRTGISSRCICLDCLYQFEADLAEHGWSPYEFYLDPSESRTRQPKDERKCPSCKSTNVKTELEMVGKPCPECEEGVIEEVWTGAVS